MSVLGTSQPDNTQKLFALSGIVAPILFGTLVFVEGLLRPGYDQVIQAISDLGRVGSSNAVIQDANFVLTGLLIILFVVGLRRSIGQGTASKVGISLLFVFPLVLVLVGTVFPLPDPLHTPVSLVGFVAMIVAIFVISRAQRKDSHWRGYAPYSLATGVVLVVLFLLAGIGGQGVLAPWFGLLQRLFLAPMFLWIEIIAVRLYVLSNRPRPLEALDAGGISSSQDAPR